jgi:LuxR family maltose regulon positive regulatory protein
MVARAFEQDAVDRDPGVAPGIATVSGLVTERGQRELEGLRHLAAVSRTRRSPTSCIWLDTVKKHVTHSFEEFGAANRTEAAVRARQLGFLA